MAIDRSIHLAKWCSTRYFAPIPNFKFSQGRSTSLEFIVLLIIIGPRREKPCLRGFSNNNGADQPAHPRSLISAFVTRLLESIISNLATSKISIYSLVYVAVETGLSLTMSETPKTGALLMSHCYLQCTAGAISKFYGFTYARVFSSRTDT